MILSILLTVATPYHIQAGKTAMTMSSTAKLMWKEGGVKIFFRGWTPLYSQIAPHTLAMFLIMEQARMILGVATH